VNATRSAAEHGSVATSPNAWAGAALADRGPKPAVPPVDLRELARKVAGALIAGRGQEARADLTQMILQDRQRARISLLAQLPSDHRSRHLGGRGQGDTRGSHGRRYALSDRCAAQHTSVKGSGRDRAAAGRGKCSSACSFGGRGGSLVNIVLDK